jgi:hypothetical protein
VVQSAGFHASMSRKADCYDNAPMERFFHTLKPTSSITGNMQRGPKPHVISLPTSRASTTGLVATPPSVRSAQSRSGLGIVFECAEKRAVLYANQMPALRCAARDPWRSAKHLVFGKIRSLRNLTGLLCAP